MRCLVTCSLKYKQKLVDSRICHSHGELRIVEFPEGDATLKDGLHGRWMRIDESPEVVMQGHHKVNGGCFVGNDFYVTTFGQVLRVNLPEETWETFWTAPHLNDLHFVGCFDDRMYVVNTGLERIEIVDAADANNHVGIDLLQFIKETRDFDPSVDYRHVWSTQPHLVHANHCFRFDGEIWVTRFCQKDALAIESGRRIDLSQWGNPHDGCVQGDEVFFTTTNGFVISYSRSDADFRVRDLNRMIGRNQLGWCRGLSVKGDLALIAFTQFRPSITKEMGKWILLGSGHKRNPTCIVKVDLKKEKVLAQYQFNEEDLTIYGIYPV